MQTALFGDELGTGPEHEVIRVPEDDLGTEIVEVGGGQRAHRGSGADGHEARGGDGPPRRDEAPHPGRTSGGVDVELERHQAARRSTSMASPNERKRYPSSSAVA